MRIVLDVDGTICTTKGNGDYRDVVPLPGAVETLKQWKLDGHYLILQTARHMYTYASNEGKILANFGYFYEWLAKWEVPFDEIYIGKPHGAVFIDDKGYRHIDWEQTKEFINNFQEPTHD